MRSPPMCMSYRLHLDTKGWDWVPSEKFSLFTSAWSVWNHSLVTSPDLWLVGCGREGGGKSAEWAAASLCQRPWEGKGKGGWAAQGRASHFSPLTANSTLAVHRNPESSLPEWWIFSSWCSLPSWSEVKVFQSCLTLWDPMDCCLRGSSVHGILQARILEWIAIPFFRGSSQPWDKTQVSGIAGRFFTIWATSETHQKSARFVLQYLSVLGDCRGSVESTAWEGGERWIWLPRILLGGTPVNFCFWSLF